jgi:multiple sugar transport system substrate-binding protein
MVDLVQKFHVSPDVVTKFTEVPSYEYFIRNDGLFIRGWNSYDKDFQDAPYDRQKERFLRKAPVPFFRAGHPASVFGGWNLMVSKFSTKKEAVLDFVKFLLQDDSQEVFYARSGFYPVVRSFYEDSASRAKHPEIAGIRELIRTGVHRPPQKDYTNCSKIMSHYFSRAIRNELSVDEALEGVNREIRSEKLLVAGR